MHAGLVILIKFQLSVACGTYLYCMSLLDCQKFFVEVILRNNVYLYLSGLTTFMPDTVILNNEEKLIEHLLSFLNDRKTALRLCYRASVHGWSSQNFHQHCDDKAGTVVLVKVGNYIFGGYTDQTWHGKDFTDFCL